MRPSLPTAIEVEVLTKSARRCALCYGLSKDYTEKQGQIAHLDRDNTNHSISNLVFLCLQHHDRYDSISSQSKGYRKSEVVHYRDELYAVVANGSSHDERFEEEADQAESQYEAVTSIKNRYFALDNSTEVLRQAIMARVHAVYEFIKQSDEWMDKMHDSTLDEDEWIRQHDLHMDWLYQNLSIPRNVWGVSEGGGLPNTWIKNVESLVTVWVVGEASYDECTDLLWLLDDCYDLDLHWMLYGIPNKNLPRLGYTLLNNFVYVFGLRGQSEKRCKVEEL